MKIRNGFVSNSSSSSFIVAVKENYNPTVDEIKQAIKNYCPDGDYRIIDEDDEYGFFDEDGEITQTFVDFARHVVKKLSNGGVVYDQPELVVAEVAMELPELIELGNIETGPDGGCVIGVKPEKMTEIKQFFS